MAEFSDISALEKRRDDIHRWLKDSEPECFSQQKHTIDGSQERVYWHYGYMVALVDVLAFLTGQRKVGSDRHAD